MIAQTAFVGDVHGNLAALEGLFAALAANGKPHAVFLGDYLNKGPKPATVLELLIQEQRSGTVTLLAGNHETVLLDTLETGTIAPFLKMGGATTIRSYLHRPARPEVLADFRAHLPEAHVEALRSMPLVWETDDVIAQHAPPANPTKYAISAHVPVGPLPRITSTSAQLDTGSGSDEAAGRLTAFLWPSRAVVQVRADGSPVGEVRQVYSAGS